MKFTKREDRVIKYKALYWLRIKQRCSFIATEVGGWSADVLGANEKKMIEVEVKINKPDLLKDIQKPKHRHYTDNIGWGGQWERRWIPTHFYYAVPARLVEDCRAYLTKHKLDSYGIINTEEFEVVKRAAWLHKNEPDSKAKFTIALRMGSELLRFHEAFL